MRQKKRIRTLGLALAVFLLLAQCGPVVFASSVPTESDLPVESVAEAPPTAETPPDAEAPLDTVPPDSGESLPDSEPAPEEDSSLSAAEADGEDAMAFGIQSTILDASTIIVYTFDELVTALTQNNGYTTVYIGADITGKSGGANIDASKQNVMIDGCPPDSPAGTRFTYTDYDSTGWGDTIRISNTGVKSVTVQNLNVVARNYYGLVSCNDNSAYTPAITYNNVTYSGPQPIYNRYGASVVIDSTFTITKNGASNAEEFAETNRMEFGGSVTINSSAAGSAILWMTNAAPVLVVRGGANVAVTAANYFIYNDSNTAVSLESGSSLSVVTGTNGFTYGSMAVASLSLAANASLSMTQNAATSNGALRIEKALTVGDGAYLDVQGRGVGAGIQFTRAGATATFTNPARVRILTTSALAFGFTSGTASSLSITAGALNLWSAASGLLPSAAPTAVWNKAGAAQLNVQATYVGNILSLLTSNLLTGDPISQLLTTLNFGVRTSQLVAFGACPLSVNEVTDRSLSITGSAGAGAQLSAAYVSALGGQAASGAADDSGAFSLALGGGAPLPLGIVTVTAAWNGLHCAQTTVVVSSPGALMLTAVPQALDFGTAAISSTDTLVRRQTPGFAVSVSDTRLIKSPWSLQVSITGPLQATVSGTPSTLPNALVFVAPNASRTALDTTPLTVHTHPRALLAETANVSWGEDEGILLLLPGGQGRAGASYSTTLRWYLVDAP